VYLTAEEAVNYQSTIPASSSSSSGPSPDGLYRKTIVHLQEENQHDKLGPNGESYCYWQVTVKGGRETRDLDAVQVARVS
jgi:imidazole glycerol phosphate synthase subunit HisF